MATPGRIERRREPNVVPGREEAVVDRGLDDLLDDEELPPFDRDGDGPSVDGGDDDALDAFEDSRGGVRGDASNAGDLAIGDLPFVDDDRGARAGDLNGMAVDDDRDDDLSHLESGALGDLGIDVDVDDLSIEEGPRSSADDGGIEGTSEDIDGEIDEQNLPELDADEDGSFDLDDLMRELRAEGLGHESSSASWIAQEALAVPGSFRCVAVEGGRVVAGGTVLVVLEPGSDSPRRHPLQREATSVLPGAAGAIVGSVNGAAFVAPGETLSLFESELPVHALASSGGRTWALAGDTLWQIQSPPASASLVRRGVSAVAALPEAMVVITADGHLARFRGDDGAWAETPLAVAAKSIVARCAPRIALGAAGRALAITGAGEVFASRDGGVSGGVIEIDDLAAATFGAGPEPLLYVAVWLPEALVIHSIDSRGRASVEGRVALSEAAPQPTSSPDVALAWDETRERLFVAMPSGLVAIGPRRTH